MKPVTQHDSPLIEVDEPRTGKLLSGLLFLVFYGLFVALDVICMKEMNKAVQFPFGIMWHGWQNWSLNGTSAVGVVLTAVVLSVMVMPKDDKNWIIHWLRTERLFPALLFGITLSIATAPWVYRLIM